jgi:hypothetical protein
MNEREAIVAWLRDEIIKPHKWMDSHVIWAFLWAVTHPMKFGKLFGRLKFAAYAAEAIERGDHLTTDKEDEG